MPLIVGLLLIILGAVALYAWFASVLVFLQGLVAFSLLFWGLLSLIVGYASLRAKSQLKAALNDQPAPEETEATPSA